MVPPAIELALVQLPGREARIAEPPASTIADILSSVLIELADRRAPHVAVFGHCAGAVLAFELARAYADHAEGLRFLAVAAQRAPDALGGKSLSDLPDDEFLQAVGRLGGIPSEVLAANELLDLILPALRADFHLVEEYQYRQSAPLHCPILALAGTTDVVLIDDVAQWRRHTDGACEVAAVNGGHFFVDRPPQVLLDFVRRQLPASAPGTTVPQVS